MGDTMTKLTYPPVVRDVVQLAYDRNACHPAYDLCPDDVLEVIQPQDVGVSATRPASRRDETRNVSRRASRRKGEWERAEHPDARCLNVVTELPVHAVRDVDAMATLDEVHTRCGHPARARR